MKATRILLTAVSAAAVLGISNAAIAKSPAEFYDGKTLTIYVGVSPGGIYGTMAQLLSRHMAKHMIGKPTIIVKHLRGAGGTKAVNYVYNVAPQDGSVAIAPNAGIDKRMVLKLTKAKYDPSKFQWLGGWGEATNTMVLRKDAGVHSIAQAKKKQAIVGAIGRSNNTYMLPSLLNNALGTKFKIVTGYRGGSPIRKAIETGELHGWAGGWLGWTLRKADWIRDGKISVLVQMGSSKHPDLPNVPLLSDLAQNADQREIFEFIQTGVSDRAFAAAPRVPKDRAAALGKAYWATLHDKEFLSKAKSRSFHITPIPGPKIQKFVNAMMKMSPEKIKKARKLLGLTGKRKRGGKKKK
ncbi:MAG: hypothetical protein GKS01_14870 [Alphaproteobacteria bacterium]|nr:hypothetical protein [Alphaproteobacteria bacterium]